MKLSEKQRERINLIVTAMMECNNDPTRAGHDEEYGVWYECINAYLSTITGCDIEGIKRINWNWYGNASFADDAQSAIDDIFEDFEWDIEWWNGVRWTHYDSVTGYSEAVSRREYAMKAGDDDGSNWRIVR